MFKFLLFLGITVALSSCKGLNQPKENPVNEEELVVGKRIEKLSSSVARVFQDSKNNYWFANNGVVKYDGETLIQYTISDGLYANRVRDIQEDHLGNIYFDTGSGVNKFDGKTIEKLTVTDDPEKAKKLEPNDLWFAGDFNMNGAYRYDGKNLYHLTLPMHELDEEARRMNPGVSFTLYSNYSVYKDNIGNIWMGGSTFGACRFDGSDLFWVSEREMTEIDPGPAMGVRSIAQDSDGYFYFASNIGSKYQIIELDGEPQYKKLEGIDTSKEPDAYSSCISMVIDDSDKAWIAHYKGGVWMFDGEMFKHFPILIDNEEAELFSIYKDRSGVLWLGTHNAGTWKFNGETFVRFIPKISKN